MRISSLLTALAAIAVTSAQDLATALSGQEDLSTLADILTQFPEIAQFVASQQDVTLFAPNNEALAAILQGGGIFSLDQASADPSLIEQILRYHLVRGAISSDQITEIEQFVPTYLNYSGVVLDNEVSGSNVTGGQVVSVNRDAEGDVVVTSGIKTTTTVITADIAYDNGIVHIIDDLLTIPLSDSVTLLTANLTALAAAATQADLVTPLEEASDLTIFAPNNDAFRRIASLASSLPLPILAEILRYHVVAGTVAYSTTLTNTTLTTLQGSEISIQVNPDGAVFVDGGRVINTDILVANGVVHVIDQVLNTDDAFDEPGQQAFSTRAETFVPFTSLLPEASSTYSEITDLAATTSFVAAGIVSATPTSSGASNGSAASSAVPEQQTGNAGAKNEISAFAAAVFGAMAFAMDL